MSKAEDQGARTELQKMLYENMEYHRKHSQHQADFKRRVMERYNRRKAEREAHNRGKEKP